MIKSVVVDGEEAVKMMVDGHVAWERGGIPAGYQRCEYMESVGLAYINTLAIPDTTETFDFKVSFLSNENSVAFGVRNDGTYTVYDQIYLNSNIGQIRLFYGSGSDSRFIKDYGESAIGKLVSDNITVSLKDGFAITLPIYLFNLNICGAANEAFKSVRIYHFKMGRKVDMIPCLDPSGVPCMYDTVTKQPFYNQGTGEFLYELA